MNPSEFLFWHFSVLWWKFAKFFTSFCKQQVSFSSHFAKIWWKITPLNFFSLKNIYFAEKEPIKVRNFNEGLSSIQAKTCQIPYVNFETTIPFLFKFTIPLRFHERQLLCTFLSSNNTYFARKGPIKVKTFDTFKCSGQNLSNSLYQFWNDKSIPLQILYPSSVSWKIIPLYLFSSNNIYFVQKEHIKTNIFEAFKCSDENCQIPEVHFEIQTLHHSSLS